MAGADCFRGEDTGGGGGGGAAGELGPLSLRKALRAACIAIELLMASPAEEWELEGGGGGVDRAGGSFGAADGGV